jgi:hypothetical protein
MLKKEILHNKRKLYKYDLFITNKQKIKQIHLNVKNIKLESILDANFFLKKRESEY